jgi:hypothetical protein
LDAETAFRGSARFVPKYARATIGFVQVALVVADKGAEWRKLEEPEANWT